MKIDNLSLYFTRKARWLLIIGGFIVAICVYLMSPHGKRAMYLAAGTEAHEGPLAFFNICPSYKYDVTTKYGDKFHIRIEDRTRSFPQYLEDCRGTIFPYIKGDIQADKHATISFHDRSEWITSEQFVPVYNDNHVRIYLLQQKCAIAVNLSSGRIYLGDPWEFCTQINEDTDMTWLLPEAKQLLLTRKWIWFVCFAKLLVKRNDIDAITMARNYATDDLSIMDNEANHDSCIERSLVHRYAQMLLEQCNITTPYKVKKPTKLLPSLRSC